MRKSRFTETQIVAILKSADAGKKAKEMGISLGKTNYCLKGLMEEGWLKARNFNNSNNKIAYAYILTPTGLSGKAKFTARYLKRKVHEYETLKIQNRKTPQGSLWKFIRVSGTITEDRRNIKPDLSVPVHQLSSRLPRPNP